MNAPEREKVVTLSGLFEAAQAVVSPLRPEERVVAFTWIVGFILVAASDTGGPDISAVFIQYFRFFSLYLVVLFILTRVFFWIDGIWFPKRKILQRVKYWFWGKRPDEYEIGKLDRFIVNNDNFLRPYRDVLKTDMDMLRSTLLLVFSLVVYSNIKTRVQFINGKVGDETFLDLDNVLFGTQIIADTEQWFAANPGVVSYFQQIYIHDYLWMVVLVGILYIRRDVLSIRWTMSALSITYIVGVIITVIYPSLGPCFIEPERFEWLQRTAIGGSQRWLAEYYMRSVRIVAEGGVIEARAFTGIAAFPSLHVAHMVVMMMIALRSVPVYCFWMLWITVATVIATIGFGWHYAVDAVGGFGLAVIVTGFVYWVIKREMLVKDVQREQKMEEVVE